jgi:hypothetical protein
MHDRYHFGLTLWRGWGAGEQRAGAGCIGIGEGGIAACRAGSRGRNLDGEVGPGAETEEDAGVVAGLQAREIGELVGACE